MLPLRVFSQPSQNSISTESKYFQGKNLIDNKNLGAARNTLEEYISENPDGAHIGDAKYYTAFCALVLFHRDGEKLISQFIEEYPGHPKALMAYFDLGSHYYRSKNYPKTIEFLDKVNFSRLKADDRDEANFMTGYSYVNLRKLTKALPFFNALKKGNSQYNSVASYYAGYIEFENKQYKQAIEDFTKAEKSTAYASEIPYMKASALYKSGNYDELLSYANTKISSGKAFSNRHTIYLLSGGPYLVKRITKVL